MHYVYLIRSIANPRRTYIGITSDLKNRLKVHNAGGSINTSRDKPWELEVYLGFKSHETAVQFERYLKSGSGRAFAKSHLWS